MGENGSGRYIYNMERQTETYFVSRDSVALCFYHAVPSARQTLRAVRRALQSEGYAPWMRTEAELLVRGGSALVLARRKDGRD